MGFIDSYKRLEKLCGDVMGCDRPVTAYIDEMKATPRGAYYVAGWGSDLEMLKRYRWIRNQIAHEPGCTEANMCGAGDAAWIDQFYGRIMDQTDPLALYEKEMKRQRAEQAQRSRPESMRPAEKKPSQEPRKRESIEKAPRRKWGTVVLAFLLFAVIFLVSFAGLIALFART